MNFTGRSFLKLKDFTPEEITYLVELGMELKQKKKQGIAHDELKGKNIALIFEKTSTRTRCSFEVAAYDLGMHVTYLDPSGSQIGKKESIKDTARVLGRMYDGIEYRGFGQEIVEELAEYAGVPVWNGLTNEFHPTQMIADMMTIQEKFGRLKGMKLVFMGDARYNMGNSLMVTCAKLGMDFVACTSKNYFPDAELVAYCREIAAQTGRHSRGNQRRRCDLHRRLGVHGRTGRSLGKPNPGADALSGQSEHHGQCQTHRYFHALPAGLS